MRKATLIWGLLCVLVLTTAGLSQTPPAATKGKTVSLGRLLAKVPAKTRAEFLDSMIFMNGGLAGANIGGVRRSMRRANYMNLLSVFGILNEDHKGYCCNGPGQCTACGDNNICNPQYCGPKVGVSTQPVGMLLSGVPAQERMHFLESMEFSGGHLMRANVGGVRDALGKEKFEQLFARFGVAPEDFDKSVKNGLYVAPKR